MGKYYRSQKPIRNSWCNCNKAQQNRVPLQWRHNERDGVSNHQRLACLLSCLFRRKSKENIKAPHHWPLYWESIGDRRIPLTMSQLRGIFFPFDDVIMYISWDILKDIHGRLTPVRPISKASCRQFLSWVYNTVEPPCDTIIISMKYS